MKTMQEKAVIVAARAAVEEIKRLYGETAGDHPWLGDHTHALVKAVEALEKFEETR